MASAPLFRSLALLGTVLSVTTRGGHASTGHGVREVVSLDGEWQFALQQPAPGGPQSGTIQVPGSWGAQGYGNETTAMRTQVVTGLNTGAVGTYTKHVALPPCSAPGAKTVFMVDQGIHRHAIFKIGGSVVGEHVGYMTPYEHVLDTATAAGCRGGSGCEIEITLDGNRACDKGGCSDALMGCMDDDIDAQGPGSWAGLNGHVTIECRPAVHIDGGVGNIMPPHVTHPEVTTASAGKPLTINVAVLISGGTAPVSVTIFDNSSGTPVPVGSSPLGGSAVTGNVTLHATISQVKLWSPEDRALYTAVVTLGPPSAPLDSATTRFGVRTVTVDGYKMMLNGQRLFLAGYGDDAIYPMTIAAPREKAPYGEKLKFTHEHGFNFVRHHSHTLPPEYFDAADEWGILVSPELPCAYGNFFKAGNATAQALYLASWTSYIGSYRNHPSVLTWTLCNEMKMPATFKLPGSDETFGSDVFYQVKQALDPSRLMMDQDGACTAADKRDSLSFCSHQFDVGDLGCIGYTKAGTCVGADLPTKYHDGVCGSGADSHACTFSKAPSLPMVSHETGNYNTYPRLQSLLDQFKSSGSVAKPYWASDALTKLNASGLLHEADAWATASEQLFVLCWKIDVEDQRHNTMITGYEWWLIQDYWTASNGVLDMYGTPKPGAAPYITQFNARSIFLEDGLELTYVSNDRLAVDISLSNFGEGALPVGTKITWSILLNGEAIKTETVATSKPVPQGELGVVASIDFQLPDVGTSASVAVGATPGPKSVTVTAAFAEPSTLTPAPLNSWNATLFPRWVSGPSPGKLPIRVTDAALQEQCGFNDCEISSAEPVASSPGVFLTTTINGALVQRAQEGSVVVLIQRDSTGVFKSAATRFKQAWWVGNAVDNNAGTLVYDDAAPVLGGMANDHYGDQSWYHMINGAQTFLMDEWPTLPGSWSTLQNGTFGPQDGCSVMADNHGCPTAYPFPVIPSGGTCGPACKGIICYKTAAEAKAGEGPCGSWCTKDATIGKGCGPPNMCPVVATSCPAAFPFPTEEHGPSHGDICYKHAADAKAGTGACGSWCTKDPSNPGAVGCGDPKTHLCPVAPPTNHTATSCNPAANASECQARCDGTMGCSAINYNSSHGCCLENCGGTNASVPLAPPQAGSGCCGYFRESGGAMPKDITVMMRAIDIVGLSRNKLLLWSVPLGKGHIIATGLNLLSSNVSASPHAEQSWVLDRLLRYANSLLVQQPFEPLANN